MNKIITGCCVIVACLIIGVAGLLIWKREDARKPQEEERSLVIEELVKG